MSSIWLKPTQFSEFAASQTNAHRIASSTHGWIERLADDALISFKSDAARDDFLSDLDNWSQDVGWSPQRVFGRFLPRRNAERISPTLIRGNPNLPSTSIVTEGAVSFGIDFTAGYSHGLFLDQRANRAFLHKLKPRSILNTFAYTCSFSVVAALAGAATLSIDLSRKSLDRGRDNFTLNQLQIDSRQRFISDDVLDVLPRLARRGEQFDAIILDPPTFSRGNKGRRWQVEEHFESLLHTALDLALPSSHILLSSNCTSLDVRALERMGRFCAKLHRRSATFHQQPQPPDFPPGHGAASLWMHVR